MDFYAKQEMVDSVWTVIDAHRQDNLMLSA